MEGTFISKIGWFFTSAQLFVSFLAGECRSANRLYYRRPGLGRLCPGDGML
jgi:hypothetical protein